MSVKLSEKDGTFVRQGHKAFAEPGTLCPCCGALDPKTAEEPGRFGSVWCACGLHVDARTLAEAVAKWNARCEDACDGDPMRCPCCGSEVEAMQTLNDSNNLGASGSVWCQGCGLHMSKRTLEGAIEAWNRRI